ncbi:MAG TPA: hypothetical protein VGF55_23190, partial [Gemmataceae bacterium]
QKTSEVDREIIRQRGHVAQLQDRVRALQAEMAAGRAVMMEAEKGFQDETRKFWTHAQDTVKETKDREITLEMAILSVLNNAVLTLFESAVAGRSSAIGGSATLAALQRARQWLVMSADLAHQRANDWLAAHRGGDPLEQAHAEMLRRARELILHRRFA